MSQIQAENLPAVLCFHGHGTNTTIFQYQCRHIVQALANTFRFVFVDSPFEVQHPGPGVLPTFADLKPFRRWNCDESAAEIFGMSAEDVAEERGQIREILTKLVERERVDGPGVVGILAFSQGARVATGLCLDRELSPNIKFAIMICGAVPATLIAPDPLPHPLDKASIHIQCISDPWKFQNTKLSDTYFNKNMSKMIKFTGGHGIPGGMKEAAQIADEVVAAWERSSTTSRLTV